MAVVRVAVADGTQQLIVMSHPSYPTVAWYRVTNIGTATLRIELTGAAVHHDLAEGATIDIASPSLMLQATAGDASALYERLA